MGWESLEDKEVWRFRISQEVGVEGDRVGKGGGVGVVLVSQA